MDCVQTLVKTRGQARAKARANKQSTVCSFPCEKCWQFHVSILFLPPPSYSLYLLNGFEDLLSFIFILCSVGSLLFARLILLLADADSFSLPQPQFAILLSHSLCVCVFAVATNNGFKLELKDFLLCSLENCDEIHDYFFHISIYYKFMGNFPFCSFVASAVHIPFQMVGISRSINISLAEK